MSLYNQDAIRQAMVSHYLNQRGSGSNFPVFRGSPVQYGQEGEGFADFFRGVGRFFLPILQSTASTFVSSAAKGLSEGKSLGEAAKSALTPTMGSAMSEIKDAAVKKFSGSGRKRRRSRKQKGASKKRRGGFKKHRKSKKKIAAFFAKLKKVYKGRGKKRRGGRKRSKRSKHFKSAFPNF